jgi:hypothetical protein
MLLIVFQLPLPGQTIPPPASTVIIEGQVVAAATNAGLSGMTVQLTAAKGLRFPKRILQTDQNGYFRFQDRNASKYQGAYLLEVSNGQKLLFRKDIDTRNAQYRRVRIPIR